MESTMFRVRIFLTLNTEESRGRSIVRAINENHVSCEVGLFFFSLLKAYRAP